jgi:DNA-binding CsgD family transcriptional regulator
MASSIDRLSRREREVLGLLALGHTNREVAEILHISIRTAEFHRASLRRKLGIASRSELVKLVIACGDGSALRASSR